MLQTVESTTLQLLRQQVFPQLSLGGDVCYGSDDLANQKWIVAGRRPTRHLFYTASKDVVLSLTITNVASTSTLSPTPTHTSVDVETYLSPLKPTDRVIIYRLELTPDIETIAFEKRISLKAGDTLYLPIKFGTSAPKLEITSFIFEDVAIPPSLLSYPAVDWGMWTVVFVFAIVIGCVYVNHVFPIDGDFSRTRGRRQRPDIPLVDKNVNLSNQTKLS
jgi:hypothetical protein